MANVFCFSFADAEGDGSLLLAELKASLGETLSYKIKRCGSGAGEIAHWAKMLATRPEDPSLSPRPTEKWMWPRKLGDTSCHSDLSLSGSSPGSAAVP